MSEKSLNMRRSKSKKVQLNRPDDMTAEAEKEMMAPVLTKDKERGLLSAPQNIQRHISQKARYLEILLNKSRLHRQEVLAAQVMRELTTKFGTRGKSAKKIFLQAFEDDMKKMTDKGCGCINEHQRVIDQFTVEREEMDMNNTFLARERPAAIVAQSSFVRYLMDVVHTEMHRIGCQPPIFDQTKEIEQAKKDYIRMTSDFQQGNIYNLADIEKDQMKATIIVETEEKLIARLKIYKRAFSSVILHFTALRPILLDIKRNYDTVLAWKNEQMLESRVVKKSIESKEQSMDHYMADLRFECYREMSEMEKQSYILMKHINKQDAAIKTMTEILTRLEEHLSEEHELRRDSDDQKKMLIQEVNEYRKKLGMPMRTDEIGQVGHISEVVEIADDSEEVGVLSTEDPLILKKALLTCRKNLNEALSRLAILEAQYESVSPRYKFEAMERSMVDIQAEYDQLTETYTVLPSQVQALKDQLAKLIELRGELPEDEEEEEEEEEEVQVEFVEGGIPYWNKLADGINYPEIIEKFNEELTNKLGVSIEAAEREGDPSGDTEVTMQQFYKTLITVYPQITEEKIVAALIWVFTGVAFEAGDESLGLPLMRYIKNSDVDPEDAATESDDDEDFEMAIKIITERDDKPEEEPELTEKQKRRKIKELKATSLRHVLKLLKGSGPVRPVQKIEESKDKPPAAETTATNDVAASLLEQLKTLAPDS